MRSVDGDAALPEMLQEERQSTSERHSTSTVSLLHSLCCPHTPARGWSSAVKASKMGRKGTGAPTDALFSPEERVMWKMSPVEDSPRETRPLNAFFALLEQNQENDKWSGELDPTMELWRRCGSMSATSSVAGAVADSTTSILDAYNSKDIVFHAPVTPTQLRSSPLQRQRTHITRGKRADNNVAASPTEDRHLERLRLIDQLRMSASDWKECAEERDVCAHTSQFCVQEYSEVPQNMSLGVQEGLDGLSEAIFDEMETLDTLLVLSDEDANEDSHELLNDTQSLKKCYSVDAPAIDVSDCPLPDQNMLNIQNVDEKMACQVDSRATVDAMPLVRQEAPLFTQNLVSCDANVDVSFTEDDFICTSFPDDMLDEEMEAVLSVLDTCQDLQMDSVGTRLKSDHGSSVVNEHANENNQNTSIQSFGSCNDKKNCSFVSYRVCDVKEEQWIDSHGYKGLQKVVTLNHDRVVQLRQDWFFTPVEIGDDVYVHGQYNENHVCIVDNYQSLFILNPDYLVSCTSVANSYSCIRKTILQERVKIIGDVSKSQIYGKILHSLFQLCLENDDFSLSFLREKTQSLVLSNLEFLNEIGESIKDTTEYIFGKFPNLQDWASRYLLNTSGEKLYVMNNQRKISDTYVFFIDKLLKVEEHILSPKYGLKGNIDATVQIIVQSASGLQNLIVPFELKTGSNTNVMQHRAQTILYTLLLSQNYDVNVEFGLLFYLEKRETIQVFAIHNEIRGLIIARNNIAKYLKNYENLPSMLRNSFICQKCPVREPCFVFHKTTESGTSETSGLGDFFDEKTEHITLEDRRFFQYWSFMLSREENEMSRFRKELWTMTSGEREKHGRCLSNLKIKKCHTSDRQEMAKNINCYIYTMEKHYPSIDNDSLLNSEIDCGDYIVVSDENGHYALANGYVTEIELTSITISVNRQLHTTVNSLGNVGSQFTQLHKNSSISKIDGNYFNRIKDNGNILYRIDKDDVKNAMLLARDNLVKLLYLKHEKRKRELIINLSPPKFNSNFNGFLNIPSYEKLNEDQKAAILKVMTALDYALILGMPGTGKSTTITYLIEILIANKKSVLLTSYTHSAIDNILLKLNIKKENILRLGSIERIHPDVRKKVITEEYIVNNVESFNLKYIKPSIVAATCLGITHSIFSKRTFDYCIIDEASQIVLPLCIGPLRFAKKFVLVGDHYQLPPLVRNVDAANEGMGTSLFKLLSDANPSAIVNLEYQYRMNKDIMLLSNTLIYHGKLKCGDQKTAYKFFDCGDFHALDTLHLKNKYEYICNMNECWIKKVLEPGLSVIFANTDYIPAPESKKGDRIQNEIEVKLLKQIVIYLLSQGIAMSDIAILSVYRSQIKLIRHHLAQFKMIEIDTADRFQGRDKDCIIISFVRSNDKNETGELLRDWRRLNVTFTRAKSKLIFFGSKSTLERTGIFDLFFDLLMKKQWIYDLPKNAHLHVLDCLLTPHQTNVQKSPEKRISGITRNYPVLQTIVNALGPS